MKSVSRKMILSTALVLMAFVPEAKALYRGKLMSSDAWTGVVQVQLAGGQECTGTVISPKVIVTAAHCMAGAKVPKSIIVKFGTSEQTVSVQNLMKHPNYNEKYRTEGNPKDMPNDVMIIQTVKPLESFFPKLELIGYVQSINETKEVLNSGDEIAIAYGATSNGARTMSRAGEKRTEPVEILFSDKQHVLVTNVSNFCNGDSGSGAYAERDGKKYTLGILSGVDSGTTRCLKGRAAGFVILSDHLCWIQRATNTNLNLKDCTFNQ